MTDGFRAQVRQKIAEYLGGDHGLTFAGSLVTAQLDSLVGESSDPTIHQDDLLVLPTAALATDQQRPILNWDPDAAEAAFTARTNAVSVGDQYEIYPAGMTDLSHLNRAINEALYRGRRSVEVALPGIDGRFYYPISGVLPWLRTREDVTGLYWRDSPCLIPNEEFDLWPDGPVAAPYAFALSAGMTVARSTSNVERKGYSSALTSIGGGEQRFTVAIGTLDGQLRGDMQADGTRDGTKSVTAALEFVSSTANCWRLGIDDGVSVTYSPSYHPGDGSRVSLEVTKGISANASKVDVFLAAATAGTGTADRCIANEGLQLDQTLREFGTVGYPRDWLHAQTRDEGGQVYVEFGTEQRGVVIRRQQLIVTSKMPFPALAADTDLSDASVYLTVPALASGSIYFLSRQRRRGEDESKWIELRTIHGKAWLGAARRLLELPPEEPINPTVNVGA